MHRYTKVSLIGMMVAVAMMISGAAAWAQLKPSSEVLLPYFEVEPRPDGMTTLFAVGNVLDEQVDLVITVHSNWGIEVFRTTTSLSAHEVRTFNLRNWLSGNIAGSSLNKTSTDHLRAALSGKRSPLDNMFYSSEHQPDVATGFVRIRAEGRSQKALWGDYFFVDPSRNFSHGDTLVNLDQTVGCGTGLCSRHALRFLAGAAFSGGTRLIVWTNKAGRPSSTPGSGPVYVEGDAQVYNEAGVVVDGKHLRLLPLQTITVAELGLRDPFGWLDLQMEEESFIAVQYSAVNRYSVALQSYCMQSDLPSGPAIRIEKLTNGEDADNPPGPSIPVGGEVLWEYLVQNTGAVRLSGIEVTDDQGVVVSCPQDSLEPNESMICTGRGTAIACQYANIGTATGRAPNGTEVSDSDASHYFGQQNASIDIEKHTNGHDADAAPGPEINVGSPVSWTYIVTNSGAVALSDVRVSDDKGVAVSCPKTSLRPGESMTCTGSGTATAGQYRNLGTVTAKTSCNVTVSDEDASHYFGRNQQPASIDIEKHTNGHDADTPTGPEINVGAPVLWEYFVTNTGQVVLNQVRVTDDRGVVVSCPKTTLQPNETMRCTGNGTATAGQYSNIGTVTGNPPSGGPVTDSDPSHYFGRTTPPPPQASIDIEKHTNGHDADTPTGPEINVGAPVLWEYFVTNTGQATLGNVRVTDDRGVVVSCPKTTLQPGEQMRCTGNGTATAGQYSNIGTVTGNPPSGSPVTDSDPSHYFGRTTPPPPTASIDIEKHTNGHDADTPTGPQIPVGNAVLWEYFVTNTGQAALGNVRVTDDRGVVVSCPKTTLQPGEQMRCTGNGTATAGQYSNIGTVTGNPPSGSPVTDSDPSHYYGVTPPPTGSQGCTPGYWKNHEDSWPATGYSTSQTVQSVFSQASGYPSLGSATLHQALSFDGGSTLDGAAGNLLRAAVAALLDSAHPGVDYPRITASVISDVNAALATRNRDQILSTASALDRDNNLGCPLN